MKVNVPFVYEALIIKPRHKKPGIQLVRDSVEVSIASLDSLPVAFRIGFNEIYYVENPEISDHRLWVWDTTKDNGGLFKRITPELVHENTINHKKLRFSCSTPEAPFHNIWHRLANDKTVAPSNMRSPLKSAFLEDHEIVLHSEVLHREWIKDNRLAVIDLIEKSASQILIVDGYLMTPVGEPGYEITTFGLGHNMGGTALFIESFKQANIDDRVYSALDYDLAVYEAERIALQRGDTNNIPIRTNCGNKIEVLIPEAVTLPKKNK